MVVGCAIFTLGLGLAIWAETLQTRKNLSTLWGRESPLIQSLLQQRVRRARPLPPLRFIATWDVNSPPGFRHRDALFRRRC
jgi:hypothetical protein